MKKLTKKTISFVLAMLILATSLLLGVVSVSAATPVVYTTDAVRLRSSAVITSDNIISTLGVKEKLTLLRDSVDGWAYVSRSDGTKGYCSVDYLSADLGGTTSLTGVVNDTDVNFRKAASTSSEVLKVLAKNSELSVLDNSDEFWVKAKYGTTVGYIYRTYVDFQMTIVKAENKTEVTPNWFESSALEDALGNRKLPETPVVPECLYLSDSSISVEVGKIATLSAYTEGITSIQSAVNFTTSNDSVISIYQDGTIKGLKKGSAIVTAVLPGTDLVASCKVTVNESTVPTEPITTVPKSTDPIPTSPIVTEPIPTMPVDSLVLSQPKLSLNVGNYGQITANKVVTWKSSNTNIATVSDGFIYGKASGTVQITATSGTQSATCTVTVTSAQNGVTIKYNTATVTEGKTYYNGASSSNQISWSSSDTNVAVVENGFITAKSEGKAVITAYNSLGKKTCLVTVAVAEPVRFAYSAPNTAAPGETITLYAVTDKNRTGVRFNVTIGGKTTTVDATGKISDGNTYVWTGTTKTNTAGTHKVVAYAKGADGTYKTCSDANTTIFVRKTADKSSETLETRRGTNEAITLISQFEGYSSSVYFDTLANYIPTLGYGRVIYIGESFYNDMTKREAYAYLVQTVNDGGYTEQLNKYFDKYEIKRNQQQFDALLSFVYNLGAYALSGDTDFKDIFLATGKSNVVAKETDAYINATSVNFRKEANTSSNVLAVLEYGAPLTLLKTTPTDNWYYCQTQNGTKGYVYADYVTKGVLSDTGDYSLGKVNKDDFTKLMLQYHHAGPGCVWGLLYRRVDELDVFYYGEYTRNGSTNKYDYKFTCSSNSSTYL